MRDKTTYIHNKKVFFNYEVQETFEAGIELLGFEVKSIKGQHGNLEGAYVVVKAGQAYLTGMTVPPFQVGNTPKEYEPTRSRKLILHKKEIKKLTDIVDAGGKGNGGLTIVPISLYNNKGKIKVEICIAKGKKKADKRQTIKKRETDIEIRREMGK
ncbi:MAG: SsrA-binding protein SmpB [Candidatus Pacebacteria bacterium]|nr:SsrA-binding protein SmpB [Candidatus Paceibacterota bacterium]